MYIKFPPNFVYQGKFSRKLAYAKNNILYICNDANFEDVMYDIAYSMCNSDVCFYCKRRITKENRTIDHVFPKCWGGVSISINLVPCCKKCNEQKANMTQNQFIRWRKHSSQNAKAKYYREAEKRNRKTAARIGFVLPESWTVMYDVSKITSPLNFNCVGSKEYNKVNWYYGEHFVYPRPIIVSANDKLLKGIHIVCHAKNNGIKFVPAIILENVESI
jgi:5-methylcytosine-specific restriction endonuclease McrA